MKMGPWEEEATVCFFFSPVSIPTARCPSHSWSFASCLNLLHYFLGLNPFLPGHSHAAYRATLPTSFCVGSYSTSPHQSPLWTFLKDGDQFYLAEHLHTAPVSCNNQAQDLRSPETLRSVSGSSNSEIHAPIFM